MVVGRKKVAVNADCYWEKLGDIAVPRRRTRYSPQQLTYSTTKTASYSRGGFLLWLDLMAFDLEACAAGLVELWKNNGEHAMLFLCLSFVNDDLFRKEDGA